MAALIYSRLAGVVGARGARMTANDAHVLQVCAAIVRYRIKV